MKGTIGRPGDEQRTTNPKNRLFAVCVNDHFKTSGNRKVNSPMSRICSRILSTVRRPPHTVKHVIGKTRRYDSTRFSCTPTGDTSHRHHHGVTVSPKTRHDHCVIIQSRLYRSVVSCT